jgi:hypothetical protein
MPAHTSSPHPQHDPFEVSEGDAGVEGDADVKGDADEIMLHADEMEPDMSTEERADISMALTRPSTSSRPSSPRSEPWSAPGSPEPQSSSNPLK